MTADLIHLSPFLLSRSRTTQKARDQFINQEFARVEREIRMMIRNETPDAVVIKIRSDDE